MDKTKLDRCLKWINNEKVRGWTRDWLMNKTPDYFWEIPASSTGKYHPKYAAEEGGLVKHTRTAFHIALDMLDDGVWAFDEVEKDIILASILLHDTRKLGMPRQKYTASDHAVLVANAIWEEGCEDGSIRDRIARAIASHMGQWNKDYKTGEKVAPLPNSELEFFVHMCDYLSSKKYMEVNFDRMRA